MIALAWFHAADGIVLYVARGQFPREGDALRVRCAQRAAVFVGLCWKFVAASADDAGGSRGSAASVEVGGCGERGESGGES
jgi:hypothetical protein